MSGFLRRLARQAIGLASPVRSAARLPYAPSPPLGEDGRQDGAVPAGTAPRVAAGEPMERGDAEHTNAHDVAHETDRTRGAVRPGLAPLAEPPPVRADEGGRLDERDRPDAGPPHPPSPETFVARLAPEAAAHVLLPEAETDISGADSNDLSPASTRFVAPLLPSQRPTQPASWRAAAPLPRGVAGQGQVEETTEVHVTIGRIEVTAVHEAPAPKRPAPRGCQPMTLEEYLARRHGGQR